MQRGYDQRDEQGGATAVHHRKQQRPLKYYIR